MRLFRLITVTSLILLLNSCIALRKDVDMAKSQLTAENNAKIKVLEESLRSDMAKISARLDEIEKTLQIDKKAQENKISLSFNTLDELKSTIRDINNRIDSVDLAAQQGGGLSSKVSGIEKTLLSYEQQLEALKSEMLMQINELKPVENLTVTENGIVRLPENEEKSYNQLVDFTRSSSDGSVARKGWDVYSQKWPKNRRCDVTYWTGESYFLDKSYNNAIEYFGKIESEFSTCSKLEASYIRTAYALFYIGKTDVASKVLEAMPIKFPKTSFTDQIKELKKMISDKTSKKKTPARQNEKDTKKGDKK
jgi:TolA-binding protein